MRFPAIFVLAWRLLVEMQINKNNSLKAFVLADFVTDKVVDANAEGTKLKSYTRETGFVGSVGSEYIYEF